MLLSLYKFILLRQNKFILLFSLLIAISYSNCRSAELERNVFKTVSEFTENGKKVYSNGTAFAVDLTEFGMGKKFLTAAHVVASNNIIIETPNGDIKCRVEKIDRELDICLLDADLKTDSHKLRDVDLRIGDKLSFVGCPEGIKPKESRGSLLKKENRNILWSANSPGFYHGSSGGPVFNESHEVVGIMIAGLAHENGELLKGHALFLPTKRIIQFITYPTRK